MSNFEYDIYLAGPMRGYKDHNYPEFARVTQILRNRGYKVFSPAEANPLVDKKSYKDCMLVDINAVINKCESIVCLPGWRKSLGANTEVLVGHACGKEVCEIETNNTSLYEYKFIPIDTKNFQLPYLDGSNK